MNKVYANLHITFFPLSTMIYYSEYTGLGQRIVSTWELKLEDALKLQWVMVKRGGVRKVETHPWTTHCYSVDVDLIYEPVHYGA